MLNILKAALPETQLCKAAIGIAYDTCRFMSCMLWRRHEFYANHIIFNYKTASAMGRQANEFSIRAIFPVIRNSNKKYSCHQ